MQLSIRVSTPELKVPHVAAGVNWSGQENRTPALDSDRQLAMLVPTNPATSSAVIASLSRKTAIQIENPPRDLAHLTIHARISGESWFARSS